MITLVFTFVHTGVSIGKVSVVDFPCY